MSGIRPGDQFWSGPRGDAMHRIVVFTVVVGLLFSALPAQAGPIRESAIRLARTAPVVIQPDSCAAAATAGATDGSQRQGRVGWFLGGFFLPVIMPIVAHVSTPQPPADTVLQYQGDDARCYAASYSSAAASKRKQGAWIGSGTVIGLWIAVVAAAVSSS